MENTNNQTPARSSEEQLKAKYGGKLYRVGITVPVDDESEKEFSYYFKRPTVPIYADKYDELGLGRNMLSRSLEDAGTLWAVMFPWTGCGAYQTGVLGMSPLVFFPYAFVNLLNPIFAYVTAAFGRNIFWADGSYTNIFGKTKAGKPAGAPEEAHAKAIANLEARRAAGKAPKINA